MNAADPGGVLTFRAMNRRPVAVLCALAALSLATVAAAATAPQKPATAPVPSPAEAQAATDSAYARVRRALGVTLPAPAKAADVLADSLRRTVTLPPLPAPATPPPVGAAAKAPEGPPVSSSIPALWLTRAERSGWRETAGYDETMRYCRQLEAASRWIKLATYGTSGQGRELPLLIVSKDRAFTPEAARATGKPVVLIQNGIHSGEIEGKDASLALVRDMGVLQTRAELLDSCIVLVLPIYSVDAHERSSPYNRINQNGPSSMGWRVTPTGLNLNRDYLKAEAPETRALLANVYTRWWPELLVDDHTTDGADYRHDVTYGFAHGPAVPPAIDHWYEEAFEGRVVPALARMGHLPAPYLSFRRGNDPASGIDFGNTPGGFSTGYAPLQGRAAILVETHMLKPYGTRVVATYDLLAALLGEIRAHPRALTGAVAAAAREAHDRALATNADARLVALDARTTDHSVPFPFLGKATSWPVSRITGAPVAAYSDAPWDSIVPLYREMAATVTVRQPAGYLVPQEWAQVIEVLQRHGVRLRRLARAWSDSVDVPHLTEWTFSPDPIEGHHPMRVKGVRLERKWRAYRAGDVFVPLDQPGARLAMHLLEAQSPDGLATWNAFDTVVQKKEYGEDYVVAPMAERMLAADPALAREFAQRLASDSTFAANPRARSDFFYRRSPWADPEQDLLPVTRALRLVPETYLAPADR